MDNITKGADFNDQDFHKAIPGGSLVKIGQT